VVVLLRGTTKQGFATLPSCSRLGSSYQSGWTQGRAVDTRPGEMLSAHNLHHQGMPLDPTHLTPLNLPSHFHPKPAKILVWNLQKALLFDSMIFKLPLEERSQAKPMSCWVIPSFTLWLFPGQSWRQRQLLMTYPYLCPATYFAHPALGCHYLLW